MAAFNRKIHAHETLYILIAEVSGNRNVRVRASRA